jgi:hypothetical protein
MSPSPTATVNNAAMVISAVHADGAMPPDATGAAKSPAAYQRIGVGRRQSQAGDEHAQSQPHHC